MFLFVRATISHLYPYYILKHTSTIFVLLKNKKSKNIKGRTKMVYLCLYNNYCIITTKLHTQHHSIPVFCTFVRSPPYKT